MSNDRIANLSVEHSKQKAPAAKPGSTSYWTLYKYATPFDWLLMLLGTIGAFLGGLAFPAFTVIFANLINTFGEDSPGEDMTKKINDNALLFLYLAAASLTASYLEVGLFMLSGVRQAAKIRQAFLSASLHQDVTYYDVSGTTGDVLTGLNSDSSAVQTAIGAKVGLFMRHTVTFVACLAVSIYRGWQLSLVLIALTPLLGGSFALMTKLMVAGQEMMAASYSKANTLSSQAVSNIRTIASFGSEEKAYTDYSSLLSNAVQVGTKLGLYNGMANGAFNSIIFCMYSLAFWYGAKLVRESSSFNGGDVINVVFGVIIGGFSLGQAAPNIQHFAAGAVAGRRMFDVINRTPAINSRDPGIVPTSGLTGSVRIENVKFSYPARPDVAVFKDFSLTIAPGEQVAIVGASGSGKSTVIQLLERFYDPEAGRIIVDGIDLKSLSLSWYRSQVGLVSQEPVLFATTIRTNIMMGQTSASETECVNAAKAANAHSFISILPDGYDTHVGERGVQLSGGQKQRIAIARAILKNPRLLLLDEATSALDTKSERTVQTSIEALATGRTTVVVAHRLSTIRNSEKIAVIQAGQVVETGNHDTLYADTAGVYHALVKLQQQAHTVTDAFEDTKAEDHEDMLPVQRSMRVSSSKTLSSKKLETTKKVTPLKDTDEQDELTEEEKKTKVPFLRLLKYNQPEWPFVIVGVVTSCILGLVMPIFSIILSSIITLFFSDDVEKAKKDSEMYALMFFGIAVALFFLYSARGYSFGRMGSFLAQRVRLLMFRSLLYQEVGWFDQDANTSGAISSRLSSDAAAVRGATGDTLGVVAQNLFTLLGGYTVAFINGWRMTLVVTAALPLLAFASYIEMSFISGTNETGGEYFDKANQTASEGIAAIRTVHSYALEHTVSAIYTQALAKPAKASERNAHISGLSFGFSQFVQFAFYGLAFWYGGKEVEKDRMSFDNMLKVFFSILLASMGAAEAQLSFPDVSKGSVAVARVFTVVDRKSAISADDETGTEPARVVGEVQLKGVTFAYPTRPDVPVFQDFNLVIRAGHMTALVGESGSGKSTIINLIERFYDVTSGQVLLDGADIRTLRVKWLRSVIGLVSQEPMLFNATILENLRHGKPDATMKEITAAAEAANAMEFINRQPDKFGTLLGEGGGISLSGGQKQRIAIARALLKDPRVLLLDEATSALDAESESVVQGALERVMHGRTSIVIAHRLTTVRNADCIAVVQRGVVLEEGSHEDLMAKGPSGAYVQLQKAQAT